MVTSEKSLVVDLGGLDQDGRRRTGECGVQTRGGMNRIEYRIQVALFIYLFFWLRLDGCSLIKRQK